MPQVAQHPPQPGGYHAARVVVDHNLAHLVYAQAAEQLGHALRAGQRMATAICNWGAAEIVIQVGVDCPGNVCRLVILVANGRIRQTKAEIYNDAAGFVLALG